MSGMSRRDLIKASAGAAALAVPITALSRSAGGAAAVGTASGSTPETRPEHAPEVGAGADGASSLTAFGAGPVMFCVHDAARGEVSIMHGADEVIVRDHRLVARVMDAATRRSV
jgi:TAT (twin-arginine translocation) pathway signal sequence